MHSPTLPLYTVSPSFVTTKNMNTSIRIRTANVPKFHDHHHRNSLACKSSNSSYSSIADYLNLYDLLGIDGSSDQAQIKVAYRALQKRCHPDVAGPAGHDMAIILNEAYALLSDPHSRVAYDKELAKFTDLQGYTGKPIYSAWFGSESEKRAVFVDELKCIGCLKCALLAEKTFAVESVYGRARVIAQWADSEHKIREAIDSCPVDCISIVKRSSLAALEFLMSKKPRGNVRIGTGNTVGVCASDVFQDLEKFQARYQDVLKKGSAARAQGSNAQSAAIVSAIQAIRNMSNWLYWQAPMSGNTAKVHQNLKLISENSTEPDIQKLINAAAAKKQASQRAQPTERVSSSSNIYNEEYWVPSNLILPEPAPRNQSDVIARVTKLKKQKELNEEEFSSKDNSQNNPILRVVPIVAATVACIIVRSEIGQPALGSLQQHIGGSLALDIVNSSWLQVILAGLTWYLIGMAAVELMVAVQDKVRKFGEWAKL